MQRPEDIKLEDGRWISNSTNPSGMTMGTALMSVGIVVSGGLMTSSTSLAEMPRNILSSTQAEIATHPLARTETAYRDFIFSISLHNPLAKESKLLSAKISKISKNLAPQIDDEEYFETWG